MISSRKSPIRNQIRNQKIWKNSRKKIWGKGKEGYKLKGILFWKRNKL